MSNEKPPIENDLALYADEIEQFKAEVQRDRENQANGLGTSSEDSERARRKNTNTRKENANRMDEDNSKSNSPRTMSDVQIGSIGREEAVNKLQAQANEIGEYRQKVSAQQEHDERVTELQQRSQSGGRGFLPISAKTLPTKGLFYPEGTKFHIKAASLGEIKHWSVVDETDLSAIDDALNDILEACLRIEWPAGYKYTYADYRDLKDIDRLYLILAIHDFTFLPEQGNDIMVTINESDDVVVRKDDIDFVNFGDKLMKYYNPDKRCFSFPTKSKALGGQELDIYIPCIGVTKWLKDYVQTRQNRQEGFDRDFVGIAPLLIGDHRGLNNDKYFDLIDSTADWSAYEWALINKIKRAIETSVTPKLKYKDKSGSTKEAPLNFRGGIKAIFQPNLDIDL
jgi:hypothetical protein